MGEAAADLKANSDSEWVQNCRTPKQAGGVTDVLIGIHYNMIHPEPVHTLESARMVAQFVKGLETYMSGDWSSPRINDNPMSCSELMYARIMNSQEGGKVFQEVYEIEREEEENKADFDDILALSDIDNNQEKTGGEANLPVIRCTTCKVDFTSDICLPDMVAMETDPRFTTDEKISKIKQNWSIMESGLQIDYRCTKCRDCSQCKNADQVEKISLREEQEMQLIKESVNLDWEKKKIVCSLPLRGRRGTSCPPTRTEP